ncbi:cellulose binding domain-containing protein [Streptomyces sp. NPDC049602]|uniref:cellulose binding domain-containing protein n=1 Tax=Streptomyces sp. NPDC049602 TaxID=3155504 RepID=UPI003419F05D
MAGPNGGSAPARLSSTTGHPCAEHGTSSRGSPSARASSPAGPPPRPAPPTARDAGWNAAVAAGASASFGFTGTTPVPTAFTLGGATCSVA